MKFTLGTEYGIRALIELAARYGDGPVPARAIATAQGIPLRFLEHQLAALHKAGIVDSQRGANGGAALARDPSEIRISEVIDALEGPLAPMYCLEPHDERCVQTHQCGVQELWMRVEDAVRTVFEQTTIADIATRHRELQPLLWPSLLTRATPQN
ncbi:MAG: Rrf2 family transcriptional regulator [Actinobacteria bacterium]|nr:MAG: Rrf2 family transcriptional regulator [Actinomycetota bacterium]TML79807.1 MAG: Rrf2 family transcriptional regulator [Actinomycetota bacterium]